MSMPGIDFQPLRASDGADTIGSAGSDRRDCR
jgi:hypothetical protein